MVGILYLFWCCCSIFPFSWFHPIVFFLFFLCYFLLLLLLLFCFILEGCLFVVDFFFLLDKRSRNEVQLYINYPHLIFEMKILSALFLLLQEILTSALRYPQLRDHTLTCGGAFTFERTRADVQTRRSPNVKTNFLLRNSLTIMLLEKIHNFYSHNQVFKKLKK